MYRRKIAIWQCIRENLLTIDILKSKKQTNETIEKVFDLYEMSLNLAIQYRITVPLLDVVSSYCDFLLKNKKYNRCVEVLEIVQRYAKDRTEEDLSYMEFYCGKQKHIKD